MKESKLINKATKSSKHKKAQNETMTPKLHNDFTMLITKADPLVFYPDLLFK